tara:strand:+ start:58675 stop:59298 length:624 start_codon:yes stop_codon:yes gene_type:complete
MSIRPLAHDTGFSLLEALIAVAILAAIAAVLMPAVSTAVRTESRAAGRIASVETRATAEALVRDLMLHALRAPQAESGGSFAGTATEMSGLTLGAGSARPTRISLSLEAGRLELSVSSDDPALVALGAVVVAENIAGAQFGYFGIADESTTAAWYREWDANGPPRLVRLDMTGIDGSAQRIEALVGGNGEFECRFDSGRGVCLGDNQ